MYKVSPTFVKITNANLDYIQAGRGASEESAAVGFCLGSGLFGSYNSD